MDREYLHSVLDINDFDIQNTVQKILKSSDEQDAVMFSEEAWRSQVKKLIYKTELD